MNTFITIYKKEQVLDYFKEDFIYSYINLPEIFGALVSHLGIKNYAPEDAKKILQNLLGNNHPTIEGKKLRPNRKYREETKQRLLFAFCMSAPKAFSILALATGDDRLFKIHYEISKKVAKFIEQYACVRVRTDHSHYSVFTGKTIQFHFQHRLSRKNDPQLHTHMLVLNLTHDGKGFKALDPIEMCNASNLATVMYRNDLVFEMNKIGIKSRINEKGEVEIDGISKELCDKYSKRSKEINTAFDKFNSKRETKKGGKKLKAKIANTRKEPKLTPAEEQYVIQKLSEEIKNEIGEENLERIVNPHKSLKEVCASLFRSPPNPIDIIADEEKKIFKAKNRVKHLDYLEKVVLEVKGAVPFNDIFSANERIKKIVEDKGSVFGKSTDFQNINEKIKTEFSEVQREVRPTCTPTNQPEYVFLKKSPIAKKVVESPDYIVCVEESQKDELNAELQLIAKLANNKNAIYYLNAHRYVKRKPASKTLTIPLKFKDLSNVKPDSVIFVDNSDYVEPEYMLSLLETARKTKSRLIFISPKNPQKVNSNLHALAILKTNGLKPIQAIKTPSPLQTPKSLPQKTIQPPQPQKQIPTQPLQRIPQKVSPKLTQRVFQNRLPANPLPPTATTSIRQAPQKPISNPQIPTSAVLQTPNNQKQVARADVPPPEELPKEESRGYSFFDR